MRSILCLVCFSTMLYPQSLAVPRSGMTFDEHSKTFRPVLGVPGAAILGEALAVGKELHGVSVCSPQQFALGASDREGVVTLLHLDTLKSSEVSPSLVQAPQLIQLSAGCSAAAVYREQGNRLQILTGLPGKPVLGSDLTLDVPGRVSALAVSDDGQLAVAVVAGKAVYAVPAVGRAVALLRLQGDAAVAMRGNQDVVAADRAGNAVTWFHNAAGGADATVLAGPKDGIQSPSAVWFDSRTERVVVANGGRGTVSLLPLSGGAGETIACACEMSALAPLTDRTYQLQDWGSDQPLRILDLGTSPARVVFVASPESPSFAKGRHTNSLGSSKE